MTCNSSGSLASIFIVNMFSYFDSGTYFGIIKMSLCFSVGVIHPKRAVEFFRFLQDEWYIGEVKCALKTE